jgi:hypothetical protein
MRSIGNVRARLAIHGGILAASAYAIVANSVAIANGETIRLVYQANGTAPSDLIHPRSRAAADQRALAAFIASRPPGARFFAPLVQLAYPITFLSGRTIESVDAMPAQGDRYITITPADFTVWQSSPAFQLALTGDARLVFSSGDYALFLVKPGHKLPEAQAHPISQNRLVSLELRQTN